MKAYPPIRLGLAVFAVLAGLAFAGGISLGLGDITAVHAQPAPTLGVVRQLDASVSTTNTGCTRSSIAGCGQRVGFDKTSAVNTEGRRTTYRATVTGLVPAASATDIAYINGSATKTVRVTRVIVSGTAGTAVSVPVVLIKRSAATSGGTCAAATNVPLDSANAAATAVVTTCTANPTLGAAVGNVAAQSVFFSLSSAVNAQPGTFMFGDNVGQPLILNGVAQGVGLNLSTISVSSGVLNVTFEWTEE